MRHRVVNTQKVRGKCKVSYIQSLVFQAEYRKTKRLLTEASTPGI